jgi:polar amino acid transport system substrate-binding protein
MRSIGIILTIALLGQCLVGWAYAAGNDSSAFILKPEAREELIGFVDEAKEFVLENGKDKALQTFSDPTGKFVKGDLYIIAYDFNGTLLAHPYEHEKIGENWLNVTDPNGVALGKNLREVAKRGVGFAYYIWPNPAHSGEQELKLTYVLKVDEGLWLGAGIYLPGQAPIFSNESRKDLVAFVEMARDLALSNTRDVALKALNDRNGEFVKGNDYIFADDYAGNVLALPFQPDLMGKNRINDVDPNGVKFTQDFIALAQSGGGFTYYIYPDPERNMTQEFKLSYIKKVDDTWWLGAGIYEE